MSQGTIQNRETFLDNLAKKLGRDRNKQSVQRPDWKHRPQNEVFRNLSQTDLLEVLKKQCKAIHTDVKETDSDSLADVLAETIENHGGGPVVTWDDPRFEEYDLDSFLQNHEDLHVWEPALGEGNIEKAKAANVGVTFSDVTLAESGTVVLFSDKGKGRSVSLLPTTYIAIVPKSTIVPRMTQAARQIHEKIEAGEAVASCVNFISGPSNSADIELNLVVGVHGPVRATYILVTDR